jgi:hypothetical protein
MRFRPSATVLRRALGVLWLADALVKVSLPFGAGRATSGMSRS